MSRRDEPAFPMKDRPLEGGHGLSIFERTILAVVESGVCGEPGTYGRPDGGPTPEEQYARRVIRAARAVWDELEKTEASP